MSRSPVRLRFAALLLVSLLPVAGCRASLDLAEDDSAIVLARQLIEAPNPGLAGPHRVLRLTYGSGTDKNRAAYRDSVAIKTPSVDASKLIDLGDQASSRNGYWGFTPDSFPLNARVWYPEGDGPYPLVLVVHGNHNPEDYSDPGYDYLGELLASRGFILASVDMNFVNGGIRGENDARGWLLLKHLEQWRAFNESADSPFRARVDMNNIAIMGHSRGGEAVGHAAAFNRLSRYPDDASLDFDFNFSIKGVVAIAPVDGQYRPTDRMVPVEDVNYLVFHGSHDGDVTSFHGLRQYKRVSFTTVAPSRFKAAVYVYRANHGQWNSVWGSHDNGPRSPRTLDLRGLIPEEDQRTFAKVYVSAFLEATLRGDTRYLPLFRDHRVAGGWLPPTMYVTAFQESSFQSISDFEGDIDVTTGNLPGVRLEGDSLATWREEDIKLRSRNRPNTSASQENQVVWLGWNNRIQGPDTARRGPAAVYRITMTEEVATRLQLRESSTLDFRMAPSDRTPSARKSPDPQDEGQEEAGEWGEGRESEDDGAGESKPPIDLSVEVVDEDGHVGRVRLGRYAVIRRPLETYVLRRRDLESQRFDGQWELVLQTFSIPLADFLSGTPDLAIANLREIRLVFDRNDAGTVAVDDIGFSRMPPAFLRASASDGDPPTR